MLASSARVSQRLLRRAIRLQYSIEVWSLVEHRIRHIRFSMAVQCIGNFKFQESYGCWTPSLCLPNPIPTGPIRLVSQISVFTLSHDWNRSRNVYPIVLHARINCAEHAFHIARFWLVVVGGRPMSGRAAGVN